MELTAVQIEAQNLLDRALEARDSIKSGNMVITTHWTRDSSGLKSAPSECKIIFDGDKLRAEKHGLAPGWQQNSYYIGGFGCDPFPDAFFYQYCPKTSLNLPGAVLILEDAEKIREKRAQDESSNLIFFPDPRLYWLYLQSISKVKKTSSHDFLYPSFPSTVVTFIYRETPLRYCERAGD
ncbi:MAG: hypothetical protein LBQ54_14875 [Planctomycetaceae bacterium]|nr:hypothetical protein [Planctomycetaceae bacterium]